MSNHYQSDLEDEDRPKSRALPSPLTGAAGLERLIREALHLQPNLVRDDVLKSSVTWTNPTASIQRLEFNVSARKNVPQHDPNFTWLSQRQQTVIVEIDPGAKVSLPEFFSRAIHQIDCGVQECQRKTGFCQAGHEGTILGGQAPLLIRDNQIEGLHPGLIPPASPTKARGIPAREIAERLRATGSTDEDPELARARSKRKS